MDLQNIFDQVVPTFKGWALNIRSDCQKNITLDVGAAINAYKTIWSYPEQYKNVIIHLGSFHFLKEKFQVWTYKFYKMIFLFMVP